MTAIKLLLAATAMAAASLPVKALAAEDIERPKYEVIQSSNDVELRRYAPQLVAQIEVEADSRDAASSKGFMPLADYIFGNNSGSDKIAMTAPVTTQPSSSGQLGGDGTKIEMTAPVTTSAGNEGGSYVVQFTMPSKWTLETLPKPANPAVKIKKLQERKVIAAKFVGKKTAEAVKKAEERVIEFANKVDLTFSAPFTIAGYDGPRTPESEKRWEVMRAVKEK